MNVSILKFKKNKKLLYLESPVVRQLRENVENLLLVETTNTPQMTQTGETSTTSPSKKSILDGLDKESQKQLSKSIMSLKVQTAMGAQKKNGPKLLDDEEPAANTFKKDQGAPALPPGSLEAFFENYNSNFLTPLNFRVTYPDGMSTDYATDIKWQLLCKDVLVAKVSLDRTDIAEGEELDITFSFKSYFTNEVLLVVDESSLVFNCEDIYNKVKPNGKEPPAEDILLYETEDISQDGARIGVVTPRREALKIGINSGQKKTIKIRCTAVEFLGTLIQHLTIC